jgi:hypothetical protein
MSSLVIGAAFAAAAGVQGRSPANWLPVRATKLITSK